MGSNYGLGFRVLGFWDGLRLCKYSVEIDTLELAMPLHERCRSSAVTAG